MSKAQRLLLGSLLASACLFLPLEAAPAAKGGSATFPVYPLGSEADFLKAMGSRAVPLSEGVYEVVLASQEVVRFAFGERGRDFDLNFLRSRLGNLEASLGKSSQPANAQEVEALRKVIQALEAPSYRSTTGEVTCHNISYDYALDGGFVINPVIEYAWGSSQIGLELDFGPHPDSYADHAAGVVIFTKTPSKPCSVSTDYDLVDDGTYTYAQAWTTGNCASCLGWQVLSYVDMECSGTYRSITRSGGTQACS